MVGIETDDDEVLRQIREKKARELAERMTGSRGAPPGAGTRVGGELPRGVVHVTSDAHFHQLVAQHRRRLVVVDFSATWCGPCQAFAPIFADLAREYGDRVVFLKVDVDEARGVAAQFGVTGVPTTSFVYDGRELTRKVGLMPRQAVAAVIETALKKVVGE
ncbi:MAG: hypothetical protein Kow0069_06630 [Promethearchaeota archaeon]